MSNLELLLPLVTQVEAAEIPLAITSLTPTVGRGFSLVGTLPSNVATYTIQARAEYIQATASSWHDLSTSAARPGDDLSVVPFNNLYSGTQYTVILSGVDSDGTAVGDPVEQNVTTRAGTLLSTPSTPSFSWRISRGVVQVRNTSVGSVSGANMYALRITVNALANFTYRTSTSASNWGNFITPRGTVYISAMAFNTTNGRRSNWSASTIIRA